MNKPTYEQLKVENAQLAAKCAEMRDGFEKISGFSRCDIGCQQLCDYVSEVSEQCLSDSCGTGWLSPEKAQRLRDALSALYYDCTASDFNEHWDSYMIAKQALDEIQ